MSNDYDVGAGADAYTAANGRPMTREPYRGPRIRNRRTGEVRYWVGDRYVAQNSPDRLTSQEQSSLSDARSNADRFNTMLPDLNRFEELNRSVPTGSLSQRMGQWAGNMPRMLSIDNPLTEFNEPQGYDEMRSITSRLTPSQRVEGSGSSSNLDVTMFREGLPNVGNSGNANSRIIAGYRRQAERAQAWADFLDWYWPRTGSLTNAQSEFRRFEAARQRNPDLTWRQHFGVESPASSASGATEQWTRNPQTGQLERRR